MKKIQFLLLLSLILPGMALAQKQIQVKNQKFELFAVQNGEAVTRSTNQFAIALNYETGQFNASIEMAKIRLLPEADRQDQAIDPVPFKIEGVFPINDILYNKNTDQQYRVELNIINRGYTVPTMFDLVIRNFTNARSGYRQFIGSATLDLRDYIKQDLNGFEPEVKLIISFEGYVIGQ